MQNQEEVINQLSREIELLKAENTSLKKNKEIFQIIAENAIDNIAITTFDLKAKYLYVSPSTKKSLGYEPEDLIGKSFFSFIHPDDKKNLFPLLKKYIGQNLKSIFKKDDTEISETIYFRFKHKYGDWRHMQSIVSFLGKDLLAITRDISSQKNMQEELQQSEEKYRIFFENNDAIILFVDPENLNIIFSNKAAAEFYKYSNTQLSRMKISDLNVLGTEEIKLKVADAIKRKQNYFVFKHKLASGEIRDVEVYQTKLSFNNQEIFSIIVHDITDRIQTQQELIIAKERIEKSEKKFRELFEKSGDAFLIIENGKFVDCNEATVKLLKYNNKNKILNARPSELSPLLQPDGRNSVEKANELIETTLKNGTHRFEWNHKKSTGEIFPVEVLLTAILNEPNKKVIHTVWRDITNRKKADNQLRQSEYLLNATGQLAKVGGWLWDIEKQEMYWTKETYQIHEVDPNNFKIGSKEHIELGLECYNEEDRKIISEAFQECVNLGKSYDLEFPFISVKGQNKWIRTTAICEKTNGKPTRVIGNLMDITYRKKTELNLKAALEKSKESDRLKSAFLANMSHEIRTPMNGILGFANLLKEQELSGDEQKKYIGIIEKSGDRMLNIINDLIDISKVESGQMDIQISKADINKQIEYIYTFFKPEVEKKGMKLFFKTPSTSEEATIYTDREKIFAILTNLVKNAIKYSDTGFIEVGYETKNNFIKFYVKDTGNGIAPQMQKLIFDRFIQAHTDGEKAIQGAGLGLSISKAYVEMLGGEIWVESKLNEGSTFYFTIPLKTKNEKQDKAADGITSTDTDRSIKKLKILIAEDEEIAVQLLKAMLHEIKKEIIVVTTGKEAVKSSLNNPDIDLILMDIRMPEMNGYDAVRKIREQNKDVVIIAQTAFAIQGDKEKAIESGCNAYVSKPISKSKLLDLIKQQFS